MPCILWDISSPTRDQTQATGSGSMEHQQLDHQGTPNAFHPFYWDIIWEMGSESFVTCFLSFFFFFFAIVLNVPSINYNWSWVVYTTIAIETATQGTWQAWIYMHQTIAFLIPPHYPMLLFSSVQLLSRVRLWDPLDGSTPDLPVHHQLLESTQTHVHWVGDAIQPPHPLSSPSLPAFNLSQHQGLFKWVSSLHQVAKVLEFQLQPVLPMNIQDWSPLGWTGWISLQSKGLSRVFSNTTVQKHHFLSAQLSL